METSGSFLKVASIILFKYSLLAILSELSKNLSFNSTIKLSVNNFHNLLFQIAIDIYQSPASKNQNGNIALSKFHTKSGFFQVIEVSVKFCSSNWIQTETIGILTKPQTPVFSLLYNKEVIHKANDKPLKVSITEVAFFIGLSTQVKEENQDSAWIITS